MTPAGATDGQPDFKRPLETRSNDSEAELRDTLKRCSPATYEAACAFRRTGDLAHLPAIVRGVIERYVEPELRPKVQQSNLDVRLCEDLGLDSLTLMEIVLLAEDVLHISITHDELRRLQTLGDVQQFMETKLRGERPPPPALDRGALS